MPEPPPPSSHETENVEAHVLAKEDVQHANAQHPVLE